MIVACFIVWLVVKRWWLGSLLAGLVGAAWQLPNLMHLTGLQRGEAFTSLAIAFATAAAITAALYGLAALLHQAHRVYRRRAQVGQ